MKIALAAILVAGAASQLAAQSVPYGIDVRPQPRGTLLDSLLPRSVGPFRRAAFVPRTPIPVNEALKIDYGAGADTISLTFRIPGNPDDAQEGVKRAREDAKDRKIDVKGAEYASKAGPELLPRQHGSWPGAGAGISSVSTHRAGKRSTVSCSPFRIDDSILLDLPALERNGRRAGDRSIGE